MITSPPPPPENLGKAIFADTDRVIKSQPLHFLTLSFLFLCLPSAATVVFLTFRYPLINDAVFNHLLGPTNLFTPDDRDPRHSPNLPNTLVLVLGLFIFNLVLSSLAVGSITFSVFHAFHGRQKVNLKSSIASLAASFLPLLATNLLRQAITAATAASLLLAMLLGFRNIDIFSPTLFIFVHFSLLALTWLISYPQADWSLALTITSLKPTIWGFESMKLSKNLISMNSGVRARQIAFSTAFVAVYQSSILLNICYTSLPLGLDQIDVSSSDDCNGWNCYLLSSILSPSIILWLFQLLEIAKSTLLYVHCEASYHEADIHHESKSTLQCP